MNKLAFIEKQISDCDKKRETARENYNCSGSERSYSAMLKNEKMISVLEDAKQALIGTTTTKILFDKRVDTVIERVKKEWEQLKKEDVINIIKTIKFM